MTAAMTQAPRSGLFSVAVATGLVGGAVVLGLLSGEHLAAADRVMLFVLAIAATAAAFGRGAALWASALSVLGYDFFFVSPVHTFAVDNERNLLTFATMFGVGLLISGMTRRLRRQEREAIEREERASAAELKARTEEMRSALLSAISHDLRTPLGAIIGAGTTLRDRGVGIGDGQRRELVETICEEAERLERLVANLLEMTRLQSGAVEVKREWVLLEELFGSALNRLERHLAGRDVRLVLPPAAPLISVDPVLMELVLFNLLENAAKHTPAGSPVEVTAIARTDRVVIEVADRGAGLREGDEVRVFEKFFRRAGEGVPGAGLGLAICRGVIEAHGGVISASNRAGGGSVFRVELPLVGVPPEVPAEAQPVEPSPP